MSVYLKDGLVLLNSGRVATDAACCCCSSTLIAFLCVGVMCDTNPSGGNYTSVFDLSPGFFGFSTGHTSGSTGPSDFATLDWYVDITLDGMGGYSATYGGTVTGRYSGTQAFEYSFSGTCGVLTVNNHTDRFCGTGAGNCSDIICGFNQNHTLGFDCGADCKVGLQIS